MPLLPLSTDSIRPSSPSSGLSALARALTMKPCSGQRNNCALRLKPFRRRWERNRGSEMGKGKRRSLAVRFHFPPSLSLFWLCDCPFRGGGDERAVFGEDAAAIVRGWLFPVGEARGDLFRRKLHVEATLFDVENDHIAVVQSCDWPAYRRFRRDMADHQAVRGAAETAIGEQGHRLPQPFAHDGPCHAQHLAHAGTAARPLVANDHHIARLNLLPRHCPHRVLLTVEDARRSAMIEPLMACYFDHAAFRRDIALENHQSPVWFERLCERAHHILPWCLHRVARLFRQRLPARRQLAAVDIAALNEPLDEQRH